MTKMTDYYIFCLLILAPFSAYVSAGEENLIWRNTYHQFGYGLKYQPESQQKTVEYNDAIDLLLRNGIKSLLMKKSQYLTGDFAGKKSQYVAGDFAVKKSQYLKGDFATDPNMTVSAVCMNDTLTMIQDIINGTTYAFDMLDSDGKPGSGIKHGNLIWTGNHPQCKQARGPGFNGQMCSVVTNAGYSQLNLHLSFGACLPDSCSQTDVGLIVWDALKVIDAQLKVLIYPIGVSCPQDLKYARKDIVAIVVSSIIAFAVVMGTLADIVYIYLDSSGDKDNIQGRSDSPPNYNSIPASSVNDTTERLGLLSNIPKNEVLYGENPQSSCNSVLKQILLSLSLITNTRKLLNTSTASGSLTAINGMRVLSMWWVILGHVYGFLPFLSLDNVLDFVELLKRFSFQGIMNATYSVDTFFFMSGLLVAYTVMKKLRDGANINWAMFYIHRFWRLTPVYAFAILIWTTLYKHWIWNGTFAMSMRQTDPCDDYWWTNIIYINNFHPNYGNLNKQCMGWGWYLANDMQFYILSPLFLILLHKMKYVGHGAMLFFLTGCLTSRMITADYYGMRLPGINTPLNHTHEAWADSSPLYNKPYTRIAPYLVGMWLGYLLVINSNRVRLGKLKLLVGWCVAITIGISIIYGLYGFYKDFPVTHLGNKSESIIYIGCTRFGWSIALAWVIFVCATGNGGPVNTFLSWKVWAPLGRLTYCAYIVHPAVIFYFGLTMEKTLHYTDLVFVQQYISLVVVSYGVAFVLSMTVEAPMLGLEKVLFKRWLK
ncbi:nose resistant to fluoxetine protein 6-like isoform X1 [Mytilus galloprovincialis]|uniref:nose resistant to fluoxetine protein 6-like isoform X1 n=1 Tax=Mytilus galloprovincialis TaxID=29158 RepID=UPI003F7C78B4